MIINVTDVLIWTWLCTDLDKIQYNYMANGDSSLVIRFKKVIPTLDWKEKVIGMC